MNLLKIAALLLILAACLIGGYLITPDVIPPAVTSQNDLKKEKTEKSLFKIPLKGEQTPKIQIEESLNNREENKITQPIISEIKSRVQDLFTFKDSDNQVLVGEYYKNFLDASIKTNFTEEELASIKKDNGGRVFLLEELIEQAISGIDLGKLKLSFEAWHQLDERILTELNKISVKPEVSPIHQFITDWFKYHSNLSEKLSEENFSPSQISRLFDEFKETAKIHNSKFSKSLSQLKNSSDFVLILKARAITCGAVIPPPFYHFGGRIIAMDPCSGGVVEVVSLPCGGLLFFSYPVLAANPFLWKKPAIGSAVLGKSLITPGCCPISKHLCTPYEATVLYFGTSLMP